MKLTANRNLTLENEVVRVFSAPIHNANCKENGRVDGVKELALSSTWSDKKIGWHASARNEGEKRRLKSVVLRWYASRRVDASGRSASSKVSASHGRVWLFGSLSSARSRLREAVIVMSLMYGKEKDAEYEIGELVPLTFCICSF